MERIWILDFWIDHLEDLRNALVFDLPRNDGSEVVVVHRILQTIFDRVLPAEDDAPWGVKRVYTGPECSHDLRAEEHAYAASDHGFIVSGHVVGEPQSRAEVYGVTLIRVVLRANWSDRHIADVEPVGVHKETTRSVCWCRDHVPEEVVA